MIVLFDLDGVILDTESQYTIFWNRMGEQYLQKKDFGLLIKGQTLKHILTYFAPDTHAEVVESLNDYEMNMPYQQIPGAFAFMESLKDNGVKTAVVTSSNGPKMENVYRHFPEFKSLVTKIFTSEYFTKSKPDPECFLLAMKELGGTPETTFVFEDSVNGLKAARASGGIVMGLVTSNPIEVVEPLSDHTLPDFTQMDYTKLLEIEKLL